MDLHGRLRAAQGRSGLKSPEVMLMIAAPPEERGPRLSSGGDGRIIYRLAVPVLKSTKNLVISRRSCAGTAKKCTKKREAHAELLLKKAIVF